MKVLFVEPHPDDIVLSAYFTIKKLYSTDEIYLASVSNSPDYAIRDSKRFCIHMGINFVETKMIPDIMLSNKITPQRYKSESNPYEYQIYEYSRRYPESIDNATALIADVVEQVKPDLFITCIGIGHPMHVVTRIASDRILGMSKNIHYFIEAPYWFRKYGERIVNYSKLARKSTYIPLKTEVDEKLDVFKTCYPTEVSILRFDRDNFYTHPECIFYNPSTL